MGVADEHAKATTLRQRTAHEVREFLIITAYLYVSLLSLTLFKAAVLHGQGISYAPVGFALVKSAILAKFMLLGHAMRIGERTGGRPLIWPTLHRSFAFLVLLGILTIIEELVVGLLHGKSATMALAELFGVNLAETAAKMFILLLVLIPYFAIRTLSEVMGRSELVTIFFTDSGILAASRGAGGDRHSDGA